MCTCMGHGCYRCQGPKFDAEYFATFTRPFSVQSGPEIDVRSVTRIDSDRVSVRVAIPAKQWQAAKRKGQLGQLYGVDISNFVYHACGVRAYNPTVDASRRAMDGVKFIELVYQDSDWTPGPDNVIHVDFINKRRVA